MNINWNEASTRRGAVGLVIFIVGLGLIINGADTKAIETLLLLGYGVSSYLKFTVPDTRR
jgi:hypothetical protein